MTEPKTLSPVEALRALADGKNLTCKTWKNEFIYLKNEYIVFQDDSIYEGDFNDLSEYTAPKPKVTWVEYLCVCQDPQLRPIGHISWFQKYSPIDQSLGWIYTATGRKIEV